MSTETQKIFEAVDREIEKEHGDEKVEKTLSVPEFYERNALNKRYAEYLAAPNDDNLNAFLAEFGRYARNILRRGGYFQRIGRAGIDEVIQNATLNLWTNLGGFDRKSKIKTWAHSIIRN